ncbi:ArnT family glycosyltransferase [Neolewinella xylanilytica]|uniref:ArnT family glycosyltransferase n=1 Tax=Neolewinella xylanilytica TaxID=1514080 RepID=UPI0011B05544|nr:hypothetical protein [Neolewinella xylanilytica]
MRKWLYIVAALLLLPALLINLGRVVFIDDEGIRALVALEMLWTGNFLVPTMHGDIYLNKPPLWNWILAASFALHGEGSEWAARLPTVISLLGFGITTYLFSRRHFGSYLAAVHALTVITCGRMLFWDSMLALIDVCFSWLVYTQIMLLYYFGRRGRWWEAFGWTYLLTVATFLLKGLPAVVFQGLSIFAILGWTRSWKQLLRPAHLLTGLGCLGLLALYYVPYSEAVDLERVARRLFVESGKRTAVARGLWETVRHVFAFPFEMSYHFLPWTLLLVYLLRRGGWASLRTNDFAAFCLVAFLVNVPVYWLSPNVYPRYLLMLFPLLFASLLWLHHLHVLDRSPTYVYLRRGLLMVMTVVAVAIPFVPLVPQTAIVEAAWLKSTVLGAAAGATILAGWRREKDFLLLFCIFLLLLRVGFNLFVLPPRAAEDERGIAVRQSAERVVRTAGDSALGIYRFSLIEPASGWYLTRARGAVVPRVYADYAPEMLYIGSPFQYPGLRIEAVDSLYLRHLRARYPVGRLLEAADLPADETEELRDGMGTGMPVGD